MFGPITNTIFYHSLTVIGIAGGGGSSGGGGGGGSSGGGSSGGGSGGGDLTWPEVVLFAIVGSVVLVLAISSGIATRRAIARRRERMRAQLAIASSSDALWSQDQLVEFVTKTFLLHQKDWSAFDVASMKTYMTPDYYHYTELMLAALKLANRQNQVDKITVNSVEIVSFEDYATNALDHFEATIVATVNDIINDTGDNTTVHMQTITATQTYKFVRSKNTWLFAGIDQATASQTTYNQALESFAKENAYYYAIDWGWLLLPRRGQLFGTGRFGTSDINNHIIGMYNETLIQLYTYAPIPGGIKNYVIAQTSVPKSYGDIVVRRKKSGMNFKIKDLNKLSTEWGDFNKLYDVFASDAEQATSFELLNPTFMEKLEAVPFEVNIEVVDNVVYLYADEAESKEMTSAYDAQRYELMLSLLKDAFKEMRM